MTERTTTSATLNVSLDELRLLNNALNEVCNGVRDLDDDGEFATRLGAPREQGRQLLRRSEPPSTRARNCRSALARPLLIGHYVRMCGDCGR